MVNIIQIFVRNYKALLEAIEYFRTHDSDKATFISNGVRVIHLLVLK